MLAGSSTGNLSTLLHVLAQGSDAWYKRKGVWSVLNYPVHSTQRAKAVAQTILLNLVVVVTS